MTYALNPNAKAFTYSREELFDCITRIIAHPHFSITQHDVNRAMAIFLTFADYLSNYTQCDSNGEFVVYESDATDFEGLVLEMLGDKYSDGETVTVEDVLK
jgi:hypothetical protein